MCESYESVNVNPGKPGGKDCKFGKIEDGLLLYKGCYFKIKYVAKGTLIMDSNKLMGRYGDEFPLDLVK